MTALEPPPVPQTEGELIVALIGARLDRLLSETSGREAAERITECDARYATLPGGGALGEILSLFDATEADRAVMFTCAAPLFDPRILTRYHALTGRAWATEWLASILFARPGQALLSEGSPLWRWHLITARADQPGEPPALTADPALRAWMEGRFEIPAALSGRAYFADVPSPLADWPVAAVTARLEGVLARGVPVLLSVSALEGSGRASFVANVAQALGMPLIVADPGPGWTAEETVRVQRLARVAAAALLWRSVPAPGALSPADRLPPLFQAVTPGPGEAAPEARGLAPFEVALPAMQPGERAAMIAATVPTAARWSDTTRELLAAREALTPAAIAHLARVAPESDAEAIEATNRTQAAVMGTLAERMTGALGWEDLVLPEALASDLRDLAHEARTRRATWASPDMQRLFAREKGLVGVFHGPPGTGKTMAAQVVAREMGVDLYRIDCGAIISKYIGETAKNMGAIFARARQIDAVLFFDEADALFSRRTEVKDSNDRHANADTSYLLQLIEGRFEGTALLATNRKADMDPAFLRRIRYSFEFPRPGPEARSAIWQRAAAALAPGQLPGLWPVLGQALEITGAQIKTVLLSAHFAAARAGQPLGAAAILRAVERELAKEGRSLSARDRERIRAHA